MEILCYNAVGNLFKEKTMEFFGYSIWTVLLIFVGMMVTHDYTLSKNFITTLGTIVAMVFIMFVAILFTTLVGKIVSFITNIVTEISYRM